jgi:hypothetical protein
MLNAVAVSVIAVAVVVCSLLPPAPWLFAVCSVLCGCDSVQRVCPKGLCMARWALYNHKPPIWQLADQADLAAILILLCGLLFTIYTSVRHLAFEETLNSDKS